MAADAGASDDLDDLGLFEGLYRENPERFESKAASDDPDAYLAQLVVAAYGGGSE